MKRDGNRDANIWGCFMRKFLLAAAAMAAFSAPAHAVTVFSDSFDGEAGGATVLNYTGFANWDVLDGTVDLLRDPNQFGIACAGGSGSCVDLDGSTGDPGFLVTKEAFAFNAGDIITVNFDLSGSQRSGTHGMFVGFLFGDELLPSTTLELPADAPFGPFELATSFDFTGQFKLLFSADPFGPGTDNIGLVLDNVSLDISAVPEPASWAMMIAGFGLVGGALRTRRRETLATA